MRRPPAIVLLAVTGLGLASGCAATDGPGMANAEGHRSVRLAGGDRLGSRLVYRSPELVLGNAHDRGIATVDTESGADR